jgi:hypothetical protein
LWPPWSSENARKVGLFSDLKMKMRIGAFLRIVIRARVSSIPDFQCCQCKNAATITAMTIIAGTTTGGTNHALMIFSFQTIKKPGAEPGFYRRIFV